MKTIVVVSKDMVLTSIINKLFKDTYNLVFFSTMQSSLDHIYNAVPDLMIADLVDAEPQTIGVLNDLKMDPIFGCLPALAIFDETQVTPEWEYIFIDEYVRQPISEEELRSRVSLCIMRAERVVETNPLTRLPGNITILKQIQGRIESGQIFATAWIDIDYFKPFNDKYGFARGDEVIKMLGRLVLNMVKEAQPHGSFVGHIGGDDFVFVMDFDLIEQTAQKIIDNFSRIIPTFYDAEDRTNGNIESVDREGSKRLFPVMGLSIGITHNKFKEFSHYGELSEIASEMKKYAKYCGGSCYKIDRRQPPTRKA